MNWIVILTSFATIAVGCSYAGRCDKAEDCSPEHCCVATGRAGLSSRGVCVKLAKKGAKCNEPEAKLDYYGGKYISRCPCQEGLSCLPKNTYSDRKKHLLSLRCQISPSTTTEEETKQRIITTERVVEEHTTRTEMIRKTTQEQIVEETATEKGMVEYENRDEGTGDEKTGDEGDRDEEIGDEVNEKELPEETARGPGGEPPRDDDCENWEYPC